MADALTLRVLQEVGRIGGGAVINCTALMRQRSIERACLEENISAESLLKKLDEEAHPLLIVDFRGKSIRKRPCVDGLLVALLNEFRDEAYYRNLALFRPDEKHELSELIKMPSLREVFEFGEVFEAHEQIALLRQALDRFPFLEVEVGTSKVRRRPLHSRIVFAVRARLRELPAQRCRLPDILSDPYMNDICVVDDPKAVESILAASGEFVIADKDIALVSGPSANALRSKIRLANAADKAADVPAKKELTDKDAPANAPKAVPVGGSSNSQGTLQWVAGPGIRLLSYNLTDQRLAAPMVFPHAPPESLQWAARLARFRSELAASRADVVCVQELRYSQAEATHAQGSFSRMMEDLGFECLLLPASQSLISAQQADSLALGVFWRSAALRPVTALIKNVTLSSLLAPRLVCPDAKVVFQGSDVALAIQFRCVESARQVCVCNVQLPKGISNRDSIVSLSMTQALLDWLALTYANTPLVLCGDFNALPTGPIYRLLTRGSLSPEEDRVCDPDAYGYVLPYRQFRLPAGLTLRSAYAGHAAATYRPAAAELCACQDFVFYQPGALLATETLAVPALAGPIPDAVHPSSHLPVGAAFLFL